MQPPGPRRPHPVLTGTAATIVVTAVLLGRSVGSGHLLYRDFISVPEPVLTRRTLGFEGPLPRAVPLDGVTALLAPLMSTGLQQQVMLWATLLLAGVGTALLLRRHGVVATTVGAVVATWSPYAAERLLLGQPPTLLAWSVLPWLVLAAGLPGGGPRRVSLMTLAALPAALTPFGGTVAILVAVGLAALVHRRQRQEIVALALLGVLWCLPWLVPALAGRTGAGETDGAAAFAVRLHGLPGLVDVLGGGGVWSETVALGSRQEWAALAASLVVLLLAGVGLVQLETRRRVLMALAALGVPVAVAALATPPGLAVWGWAQAVPGVAIFRDTHRLLGLAWFAVALLAGLGAARVAAAVQGRAAAVTSLGVLIGASSLAPLSAPDAADRLEGAYAPVAFPESFGDVVREVTGQGVLILPFQPMRRVTWAGDGPFLDPLPLALRGRVIAAQDLVVQRDGRSLRVGAEDPAQATEWVTGAVDPEALRRIGITRVAVWKGTPGSPVKPSEELVRVLDSPEFEVWAVQPRR